MLALSRLKKVTEKTLIMQIKLKKHVVCIAVNINI